MGYIASHFQKPKCKCPPQIQDDDYVRIKQRSVLVCYLS